MKRRSRGQGSIRTFIGALRHWREELHPRDAKGQFIEVPDWYVPPSTVRSHYSHKNRARRVADWPDERPWQTLDRADFTFTIQPGDRWGDPHTFSDGGQLVQGPSDYYIDPTMPPGEYARLDDKGMVYLSEDFFDLSEEERRFALYRALGDDISVPIEDFNPTAVWSDVFAQGMTPEKVRREYPETPIPPIEATQLWTRQDVSVDPGEGPGLTPSPRQAVVADLSGEPLPGQEELIEAWSKFGTVPMLVPVEVDPDRPTNLNGYVQQRDVTREVYAMMAVGEGDFLDEVYPDLVAVVRREAAANGYPIDDGPIMPPRADDSRFLFGKEPFIPDEPDFLDFRKSDGEPDMERYRAAKNAWQAQVMTLLSNGQISPKDAHSLGGIPGREEDWHPLPSTLYHVATATQGILDDGFLTREQLGYNSGPGLGSGPRDVISFTDDETIAQGIYSAMLEARAFTAGEIHMRDLWDMDQEDTWGLGPGRVFAAYLTGRGADWQLGDPFPNEELLDAEPSDTTWSLFKDIIFYRDSLGGPLDPLFMNDWRQLAEVDPEEISIFEIETRDDTWGEVRGALGEWRVHPSALKEVDGKTPLTPARVYRPAMDDERLAPRRTLYRGIDVGLMTPEQVQEIMADPAAWLIENSVLEGHLGEHWTDDYNIAWNYSQGLNFEGWATGDGTESQEDEDAKIRVGLVFEGRVPPSSILQPGTREWQDVADSDGVFSRDHPEREFTILRGEPLDVAAIAVVATDIDTGVSSEETVSFTEEDLGDLSALARGRRAVDVVDEAGTKSVVDPDAYNAWRQLSVTEQAALSILLGLDAHDLGERMTMADLQSSLDIIRDPAIAEWGAALAGFAPISAMNDDGLPIPAVLDNPPQGDAISRRAAAAAFWATANNIVITPDRGVFIRQPDGTFWVHSAVAQSVLSQPIPGQYTVAMAHHRIEETILPGVDLDTFTEGWVSGVNPPDRLAALLAHGVHRESDYVRQMLGLSYAYDPSSTTPPGHRVLDDAEIREKFGAIIEHPEIRERAIGTYIDLVDRFYIPGLDGVGFADIQPMTRGVTGTEGARHLPTAFVNAAGTSYWNPVDFDPEEIEINTATGNVVSAQPEGIVAHEFAHILFAGSSHRAQHLLAASSALEKANQAAGPLVPPREVTNVPAETLAVRPEVGIEGDLGPMNVLREARRISSYASKNDREAYAELFCAYITMGDDAPEWIRVWGQTFEAEFRRSLAEGWDGNPMSSEMNTLNFSDRAIMPLDVRGIDFAQAIPPLELSKRMARADMLEEGDPEMESLSSDLGDYLEQTSAVMQFSQPLSPLEQDDDLTYDWIDEDLDAVFQIRFATGNHPHPSIRVLKNQEDLDTYQDAATIALAAGQLPNDGTIYFSVPLRPSPDSPDDLPVLPFRTKGEIASFLTGLRAFVPSEDRWAFSDNIRELLSEDGSNPDYSAPATDLWVDFMASDDEFAIQVRQAMYEAAKFQGSLNFSMVIADEHLVARATAAREAAQADFTERDADLSELRAAKLERTYGEGFAADVRAMKGDIGDIPLMHILAHAEAAGYDDPDEWMSETQEGQELFQRVQEHFDNWATTVTSPTTGEEVWIQAQGSVVFEDSTFTYEAELYADDGTYVGRTARTIRVYGEGSVYNDHLFLEGEDEDGNEVWQGLGIAYSWNRYNEAWYVANGITDVSVSTTSEGGYAWASDFFTPSPGTRKLMVTNIRRRAEQIIASGSDDRLFSALQALIDYDNAGGDDESVSRNLNPWEIAHMGHHPSVEESRSWVGRSALQGMGWSGQKNLAELMSEAGVDLDALGIPKPTDAISGVTPADDWGVIWRPGNFVRLSRADYGVDEWIAEMGNRVTPTADIDSWARSGTMARGVRVNGEPAGTITGDFALSDLVYETHPSNVTAANPTADEIASVAAPLALWAMTSDSANDSDVIIVTPDPDSVMAALQARLEFAGVYEPGPQYVNALHMVKVADDKILLGSHDRHEGVPSDVDSEFAQYVIGRAFNMDTLDTAFDEFHLGNPLVGRLSKPLRGEITNTPSQAYKRFGPSVPSSTMEYLDPDGRPLVTVSRNRNPAAVYISFADEGLTDDEKRFIFGKLTSHGTPTIVEGIPSDAASDVLGRPWVVENEDGTKTFIHHNRPSTPTDFLAADAPVPRIGPVTFPRTVIPAGDGDRMILNADRVVRRGDDGRLHLDLDAKFLHEDEVDVLGPDAAADMVAHMVALGLLGGDHTSSDPVVMDFDLSAIANEAEAREITELARARMSHYFTSSTRLDASEVNVSEENFTFVDGKIRVDMGTFNLDDPDWLMQRASNRNGRRPMTATFKAWQQASHPDDYVNSLNVNVEFDLYSAPVPFTVRINESDTPEELSIQVLDVAEFMADYNEAVSGVRESYLPGLDKMDEWTATAQQQGRRNIVYESSREAVRLDEAHVMVPNLDDLDKILDAAGVEWEYDASSVQAGTPFDTLTNVWIIVRPKP